MFLSSNKYLMHMQIKSFQIGYKTVFTNLKLIMDEIVYIFTAI